MKSLLNAIACLGLSLVLAACGSRINQANFDQISNGMTQEQVIDLLGEPAEASAASALGISGGQAKWSDGKTQITIQFLNGKVVSKQLSALSSHG